MRLFRFVLLNLALVFDLTALAQPARAEVRALLIGVSDYDNSTGLLDLKGPANDVRVLKQALAGRGVADITVVADGVAGSNLPTRANILDAFADVARRAVDGDLVYIHMSGHGTRQPDPDGDESDGLDEVFLPADTARALPGSNAITNALVDDEIGQAVRAIRVKGADVWLVLDSCHSGTGLRAGDAGDTRARLADPGSLGVELIPSRTNEPRIIEDDGPEPKGGFMAFYSARSSEIANEVRFGQGEDAKWYGLFSVKLANRLATPDSISFRQLFQGVMRDMNDLTLPGGARMQTPGWEGTLIDRAVFGRQKDTPPAPRRYALRHDEVLAGLVHGLGNGTVLGLVAGVADPADALIGYAQMEETSGTQAYLRPVAQTCEPHSRDLCPYAGSLPDNARFAQVVARPVDRVLRIAPPRDLATGAVLGDDALPVRALRAAIDQYNRQRQGRIDFDPVVFDVESYWDGAKLWFGTRAAIGPDAVGLAVLPEVNALGPALARIAKAEALARMLGAASADQSGANPNPVAVRATLTKANIGDLTSPSQRATFSEECTPARARVKGTGGALAPRADLKQCDHLAFAAIGTEPGARDVNRIHIDAAYCVYTAYERIEDTSAARKLGPSMTMCSDCPSGYSAGLERMFVVVTEVQQNAEPLNMTGLIETCDAPEQQTRSVAKARVFSFLNGLVSGPAKRRGLGMGVADVWVTRFDWRILPKGEAFAKAGRNIDQ